MATPFTHWERSNLNMNSNPGGVESLWGGTLGSQNMETSPSGLIGNGVRPVMPSGMSSAMPPPVPNRSLQGSSYNSSYYPMNSRFTNNFSSYGMGGYPYSSYGGYPRRMIGGYGYGLGSPGYGLGNPGFGPCHEDYDASMMQAIDESCQTLFGPFDALVRSISSIAMVLDSTHQAMQYSFRTVLSSADSLSKLKNLIIQLASSFSILRLLRALYSKVLRFLGLVNSSKLKEKEWSEAFKKAGVNANTGDLPNQTQPSPWLAMGFFCIMMGGPYLMFKLFSESIRNSAGNQSKNGLKVGPDCIDAVAVYDFDAANSQELSMKQGDHLKVSRSRLSQSWALATNGKATGFVPTNRLSISTPARHKVLKNVAMPGKKLIPHISNYSTVPIPESSSVSVPAVAVPDSKTPSATLS